QPVDLQRERVVLLGLADPLHADAPRRRGASRVAGPHHREELVRAGREGVMRDGVPGLRREAVAPRAGRELPADLEVDLVRRQGQERDGADHFPGRRGLDRPAPRRRGDPLPRPPRQRVAHRRGVGYPADRGRQPPRDLFVAEDGERRVRVLGGPRTKQQPRCPDPLPVDEDQVVWVGHREPPIAPPAAIATSTTWDPPPCPTDVTTAAASATPPRTADLLRPAHAPGRAAALRSSPRSGTSRRRRPTAHPRPPRCAGRGCADRPAAGARTPRSRPRSPPGRPRATPTWWRGRRGGRSAPWCAGRAARTRWPRRTTTSAASAPAPRP